MPVRSDQIHELAWKIGDLWHDTELQLLAKLRDAVLTENSFETEALLVKARQVLEFETEAGMVIDEARRVTLTELEKVIDEAARLGIEAATSDLASLGYQATITTVQAATVTATAQALLASHETVTAGLLRSTVDAYQAAQARATVAITTGALTRVEATQNALNDLARRGLTGYTDRAGRKWQLASYAEMAARTGAMRIATDTAVQTYADSGLDTVIVSATRGSCPECAVWENKVLTITDRPAGTYQVLNEATLKPVTVTTAGSIDHARAHGFQHPNCTHALSPYLPGVTRPKATVQPRGLYRATQVQRGMERHMRVLDRRAVLALTRAEHEKTMADIERLEARLDAHVTAWGLRRKPEREQSARAH